MIIIILTGNRFSTHDSYNIPEGSACLRAGDFNKHNIIMINYH